MVAIEKSMQILRDQKEMKHFLSNIDYRVARTNEELKDAYELVHSEYLKRNYVKGDSVNMRYSLFNILPDTTTFVAIIDSEIIATATVVVDSLLGLPMDDLYKDELDELRSTGNKICEISMLASNTSLFPEGTSLMLNAKKMFLVYYLFKCVFDYITGQLDLDNICIAINPKHNLTYDNLFFKDLGPLKYYDKVNGAPALGKYLNIRDVETECKTNNRMGIYRLFLQDRTDPKNFERKKVFSLHDIKHFFVNTRNLLSEATSEQLNFIDECYPSLNISSLAPVNRF